MGKNYYIPGQSHSSCSNIPHRFPGRKPKNTLPQKVWYQFVQDTAKGMSLPVPGNMVGLGTKAPHKAPLTPQAQPLLIQGMCLQPMKFPNLHLQVHTPGPGPSPEGQQHRVMSAPASQSESPGLGHIPAQKHLAWMKPLKNIFSSTSFKGNQPIWLAITVSN